ncbi:shikimate 5-dehydrogenase [Methanococcus vannielii SB]|uniref:Shikimate dehydrogenase (NADP(+)) n=1 Tax=Methanococcus vannielii (strain ATCC 35089 / DSM 1224 / JCM 13029 / OCM 148 / SB) TaxID=406327 RepID=AROE_METVS|nr:shikimate dehydrogenase [Methanococcus vannielii]A6UNU0.1 RecName: Full=Shikimate dehydrogenase (NADP(+)); Short=SDH [Methanococcus vannielii SB]ABR54162.1 shikimate 5-dehydrogenase [Methanococcus vannielii SB]
MIDSKTVLLGLIGHPVEHSFSPIMHNAAINDLKINYVYLGFDISNENLKNVVNSAKTLSILGFNVTIPYKVEIMKYLDKIDDTAKFIGAVNTVKIENGEAVGYNTDGIGAKKSLEEEIGKFNNKNILMIGSGGSSRSISFELAKENEITIINRNIKNAKELSFEISKNLATKEYGEKYLKYGDLSTDISKFDIIINTTPVGMYPDVNSKPVIPLKNAKNDAIIMDIIYNPFEPVFLKEAKKYGLKTLNGLGMLIYQGAVSFEIWTGFKPDTNVMKNSIVNLLKS